MRLLLTGATGFVGRNLLLHFLKENSYEEIFLPVRSESKLREQLAQEGFASLPKALKPLIREAPHWNFSDLGPLDHVVHGAGLLFGNTQREYTATNSEGTLKLVASLQSPKRIVILSSQAASGPCHPKKECKTEADTDEPITWYGSSKLEMERRLKAEFAHLNFVCLRPPMILGARDSATLPLFKMARGPIHLKPGFRQKQYSYVSVNDLVKAIDRVLKSSVDLTTLSSRHLFVAAERPISDRDLIKTAARVGNSNGLMIHVPQPLLWGLSRIVDRVPSWRRAVPSLSKDRAREIWPDKWVVSPESFREKFDWTAQDTLSDALKETLDWYLKSGQIVK